MDIKISCPHCETKLVVEDELVGQSVLCEECDKMFTVEAPRPVSPLSVARRKPRVEDDDDRDAEYEFDDDRPIRRKPRAKPNALVPMIFGGSLVFVVLLIAVGLFFAFGFDSTGTSTTPVPVGGKFRLSNPGWVQNQGFAVDIDTVDGRPPMGGYRVVWKSTDGRSSGHATLQMLASHHTNIVHFPRGMNQTYEIWVENEPSNGVKVSNVVTLR